MGRVNVVRPDGSVASIEESALPALERLGYRREEERAAESRSLGEQTEAHYDRPSEKIKAFGEGVAGGLTLGVAELVLDDQVSREREEYLPGWKLGGEITGSVLPVIASGGSTAGAAAARVTPTVLASRAGEAVASRVAKSAAGRAAVSAGVEGGISSATMTAAKVLTDQSPDAIESFVSDVGLGTLYGTGAGAALGAGASGLGTMGAKAKARLDARMAKVAESVSDAPGWKGAGDQIRGDLSLHLDDAEKALAREKDAVFVEAESAAKRLNAEYDLGELPDAPLPRAERRQVLIADDSPSPRGDTSAGSKKAGLKTEPLRQADAPVEVPPPLSRTGTVADEILEPTTAIDLPAGNAPGRARTVADLRPAPPRPIRGKATEVDPHSPTELDAGPTVANQADRADLPPPPGRVTSDTVGPKVPLDDYGNPMSAHEQAILGLEKEHNKHYGNLAKLEFKQKRFQKVREAFGSPEAFAKLSPSQLTEAIEELRDITPQAAPALRQTYERFLEAAGAPVNLQGILPGDIAKAVGVNPKLWSTLDERDVPFLAAWAHMRAPKAAGAPGLAGSAPGRTGRPTKGEAAQREKVGLAGKAVRYLGGRVASKALGGGFGAYMLGWQAVDAAWSGKLGTFLTGAKLAAANRIDRSLANFSVGTRAARPVAKAVAPLVSQFTPQEYEEASREIHGMAGAGGREALYASTANLRQVDPDLADKVVDQAMARAKYLSSILPKPPPTGLFASSRWTPSPVDQAKTAGIVRVVDDPPYAVEAMSAGRLTPQMAQAFRETSPALFAKVAQSLLMFAEENPDAPPHVKRQVATMLGVPADTLQLYTAQLQASFGDNPPAPGPAQTSRPVNNLPTQAQQVTER